MTTNDSLCPNCKAPFAIENPSVEMICPNCGARLNPSAFNDSHPERTVRAVFRALFWAFFLGTPVAVFWMAATANSILQALPVDVRDMVRPLFQTPTGLLSLVAVGAWAAGFCLTYYGQIFSSFAVRLLVSPLLGIAVILVYVGLLYVGCALAFGGK